MVSPRCIAPTVHPGLRFRKNADQSPVPPQQAAMKGFAVAGSNPLPGLRPPCHFGLIPWHYPIMGYTDLSNRNQTHYL